MPLLLALGEILGLLRVGFGVAGAVATTGIVMAAFASFVGVFVGMRYLLLQLLSGFTGRGACLAAQLGAILALQTMFGMIAAALAIRFSRTLAKRAVSFANAVSSKQP